MPLVYSLININDIDIITAVIGAIAAISSVYLGGQSMSDAARNWKNKTDI